MSAPLEAPAFSAARILQTSMFFGGLDPEGRKELAARARTLQVESGAAIFRLGDPGLSMMAVLEGAVRITLPGQGGREMTLAELAPGQVFGEIALLDGRPRSANAAAMKKTSLLVFERRDMLAFLRQRPDFCITLLELVCARLRSSDEKLTTFARANAA